MNLDILMHTCGTTTDKISTCNPIFRGVGGEESVIRERSTPGFPTLANSVFLIFAAHIESASMRLNGNRLLQFIRTLSEFGSADRSCASESMRRFHSALTTAATCTGIAAQRVHRGRDATVPASQWW